MAEEFGFFDPVEIAPDVFDREYNAEQFTKYFRALVTTGIMKGEVGELKVSANGANMVVAIDTGVAFIEGSYYRNTVSLPHTLDTESLGRSRIDRVVVRLDMAERKVTSFVKKGVPSSSPVAPTLTQTANLYEISLAQVRVVGGQTYVKVVDVVDERGTDIICPWAGSKIFPNFDDATLADLLTKQLTDGPVTKLYEGDLDLLIESGFYYHLLSSANAPTGGKGSLRVLTSGDGFIEQVWTTDNNVITDRFSWSRVGKITNGVAVWNKMTNPIGSSGGWKILNPRLNDTLTSSLTSEAATANAVKQVNDKLNSYIVTGYGTPEGSRTAPPGTLHLSSQGGLNTTLYVKISGNGNTGWVGK